MEVCIISGGSTGADTGAIMAAKKLGVKSVGFIHTNCPDFIKKLYDEYNVTKSHSHKNMLNVNITDVLIALRIRKPKTGKGTEKTINYAICSKYEHIELNHEENIVEINGVKPIIVLWDLTNDNLEQYILSVTKFLIKHKPSKIMISGPTTETYDCEELIKNLLICSTTVYKTFVL